MDARLGRCSVGDLPTKSALADTQLGVDTALAAT
jgi:hypothetical protein